MHKFKLFASLLAFLLSGCRDDDTPHSDRIDAFGATEAVLLGEGVLDHVLYGATIGKTYEFRATVDPVFSGDACFTLSYRNDAPFSVAAAHADSTGQEFNNLCIYTNRKVRKHEKITLSYTLTLTQPLIEKKGINSFSVSLLSLMVDSPEWELGKYNGQWVQYGIYGGFYLTLTNNLNIVKGNAYLVPSEKGLICAIPFVFSNFKHKFH